MTDEINGILFKPIFLEHLFSRLVNLNAVIGLGVAFLEVLDGF